jgi:nucleotide-binding universal stress UspA family protein
MYKKIVVAFDESKEARRALTNAIQLATQLEAELRIVTVSEPLPAYAAFMDSELPGAKHALLQERSEFYSKLQAMAIQEATQSGVHAKAIVVEGDEVQGIVDDVTSWGADLLVIGRRHHRAMSRVWGGTVHYIAERVCCSVLAVY